MHGTFQPMTVGMFRGFFGPYFLLQGFHDRNAFIFVTFSGKWGRRSGLEAWQPPQILAVQADRVSVHGFHGLRPKRVAGQWCSHALHFRRRLLLHQTRPRGPQLRPRRGPPLHQKGLRTAQFHSEQQIKAAHERTQLFIPWRSAAFYPTALFYCCGFGQ